MSNARMKRYCVDPGAIAMMQRDGIGWVHDLDAGCVVLPRRASAFSPRKFYKKLRRGA